MIGTNEKRRQWLSAKVKELDLPQETIARALGRARETLNSYLTGRSSIPREMIVIFSLMDFMTPENRKKYIEGLARGEVRSANF